MVGCVSSQTLLAESELQSKWSALLFHGLCDSHPMGDQHVHLGEGVSQKKQEQDMPRKAPILM